MADPSAIALEQYVYWRDLGLSHEEMLRQLVIQPPWQGYISSETVIKALADAYLALRRSAAA